jgi:hypothetical protein
MDFKSHVDFKPQMIITCNSSLKSVNFISSHSLTPLMFLMRKLSKRKQIQRLREAAKERALLVEL